MKIAVCAKAVPEQARRIDPETKRLDRSGEQTLNPFDANAVEEGLRLKGDAAEAEVVLFSLGPERSLDALRKALAMGADRVVLVTDEAAAGSDLVASSYALARVLEREQAELVLFGQQANDSDGAVMWAAVADRLRRPLISQVAELTVSDGAVRGFFMVLPMLDKVGGFVCYRSTRAALWMVLVSRHGDYGHVSTKEQRPSMIELRKVTKIFPGAGVGFKALNRVDLRLEGGDSSSDTFCYP